MITESKYIFAECERVYYFASTAEMAMEVYNKALIEGDYLIILSLLHDSDFDINDQEIWETIKIRDIKVINGDIRENKACYELELDIEDGGNSAFEIGIFPRWLWLGKEDNGWHVEGLMTGGEPDETWWEDDTISSDLVHILALLNMEWCFTLSRKL